ICEGFKDKRWSVAIFFETGSKSPRKVEQHKERPHGPMPPNTLASSLTPICRQSTLVFNLCASTFTSFLKSTRSSEVKLKITFDLSKVNSQLTKRISKFCC